MNEWDLTIDKLIEEESNEIEDLLCGINSESDTTFKGLNEEELKLVEPKKRGRPKLEENIISRQMRYLRTAKGKLGEAIKRLEQYRAFRDGKRSKI